MARKSKKLEIRMPPVKPVASASRSHGKPTKKKTVANATATVDEQKEVPPWAYFKPQITDKDIFESLKKTMKRNAKKDRWMLEE